MVRMKPFDAAWFYVERREAPAHFGPLVILSKPAGSTRSFVRDFVDQWRNCKSFQPPFNYRLRRDYIPAWDVLEAADIDLDYHLRHSALPEPGGERELGVLISRLHSHRLDRHRPLWECHVIEGLENDRFAIYLKLHHGQMDGIGAARLIERMCSTDPERQGLVPPWSVGMRGAPQEQAAKIPEARTKRRRPDLLGAAAELPKVLGSLGELAQDAYGGLRPEVAAPFQAPRAIFNGRIGGQRRFATQTYALDRFKRLAKAGSVTMNDVFLSASGGALRRYLAEIAALPAKSLVGQLPVNIRPAGDTSVGNHIAFMYAYLHTDIADPLERLRAVSLSTAAGKARHEALPPEAIEPFTMLLLGPYMAQVILGLGGLVSPAANLVISNVPGPRQRLYFNGARVEQIYGPSVLFHGQALNITMSSYADEVNIGFTGCRDSLPSMQKLAVYTGEELARLESALRVGG